MSKGASGLILTIGIVLGVAGALIADRIAATGRSVALIEADPRAAEGSQQVLPDSDWLRLQAICGG